jgi:SAM-dependent methyltransferase
MSSTTGGDASAESRMMRAADVRVGELDSRTPMPAPLMRSVGAGMLSCSLTACDARSEPSAPVHARESNAMTFTALATSYDEVPYPDDPHPQSHPGHLAVVATLSGLEPAPVGSCRVLEIGCARGGNVIPMAVGLPGSSFVGIDSSAGQVAAARSVIEALGLDNIAIECRSVLDVGAGLGVFDYIICHGTYSWVPAEVREKILEILARNLSPHGVAFLSYNTYPGWRLRGLVRDLMIFHAGRYDRPDDRAREARLVLEFMAASAAPFDRAYANWLREEHEHLRRKSDSYLLHDHLEEFNEPVYFHEMVERAAAWGLRFVAEVQTSIVAPESLPPPVLDVLSRLGRDEIQFEQFLDFLVDRRFRQSVFCHAARAVRPAADPRNLAGLEVAARRPIGTAPVQFRNERRLRAVFDHLASIWPAQVPWTSLLVPAFADADRTTPGAAREDDDLASDLVACYRLKVVEIRTHEPVFVSKVSDRPVASPLARYQAGLGPAVTNLRHEGGQLNEFSRSVLRLLDGTRDRAGVLEALIRLRKEGCIIPPPDAPADSAVDASMPRPGEREEALGTMLDRCFEKLARFALLSR